MAADHPPEVATLRPFTAVMTSPRRMPAAATVPLGPTTATSCPGVSVPAWRRKVGSSGTV